MELESTLLDAFVVINGCTFQVQSLFAVNDNFYTVLFGLHVVRFIEFRYDVEAIVEPRSATAADTDTKKCTFFIVAVCNKLLDLFGGNFSYRYAHLNLQNLNVSLNADSVSQKAAVLPLTGSQR